MIVIASRSSTTARVSRNVRSAVGQVGADDGEHGQREGDVGGGRDRPAAAAPAPSPAIDQRRRPAPARPCRRPRRRPAATARRGSRRSPATNSRLSSRPATKKKIASRPSAAQVAQSEVEVQRRRARPWSPQRRGSRRPRRVRPDQRDRRRATSSSAPPTVSLRRIAVTRAVSGQEPRANSARRRRGLAIGHVSPRRRLGSSSLPAGATSHRVSTATLSMWWVSGNESNTRSSSTR